MIQEAQSEFVSGSSQLCSGIFELPRVPAVIVLVNHEDQVAVRHPTHGRPTASSRARALRLSRQRPYVPMWANPVLVPASLSLSTWRR